MLEGQSAIDNSKAAISSVTIETVVATSTAVRTDGVAVAAAGVRGVDPAIQKCSAAPSAPVPA
jgi:hypothetical protein